jgi:hypothetical protein
MSEMLSNFRMAVILREPWVLAISWSPILDGSVGYYVCHSYLVEIIILGRHRPV